MERNAFLGRPLVLFVCTIVLGVFGAAARGQTDDAARAHAIQLFSAAPAAFIENTGQLDDPSIRYVFNGSGANVYHTTTGPVFQVLQSSPSASLVLSATFPAAKMILPAGEDLQQSSVNYYHGNDGAKWQVNVPTFSKVVYRGLYDGIDLHTFGRRSSLKYEFHVAPGADWTKIAVRYFGIDGLAIDSAGALHVSTRLGELIDDAPYVYQPIRGKQVPVICDYLLIDERTYGFQVRGTVDRSTELVIDPNLAWATYLGGGIYGNADDEGHDVSVDASGNALITGWTQSSDFPTPGGFDTGLSGGDAFIAKVSSTGQLLWASYLGGMYNESSYSVAVDAAGNALITGSTGSPDFPTPGGFSTAIRGIDAFVAKVSSSGQLVWASFLGGSSSEQGRCIATDTAGNALITGITSSSDFPTPGGFDTALNGSEDAFVAKVSSSCQLIWGSYLGGSAVDRGWGIAADAAGNAMIAGETASNDFPTPGGFDTTYGGHSTLDGFVCRVSASGRLLWGSYLGGSMVDSAWSIAADSAGNAVIVGITFSSDFPTNGGYDKSYGGYSSDAFVTKVSAAGQLLWSSFLGGSQADDANKVALDPAGNALITGDTDSGDFPTAGQVFGVHGGTEAFVVKAGTGGKPLWGACLSGSSHDYGIAIASDPVGNAFVTGTTNSHDFPTSGGFDTTLGGSEDAFVAKIALAPLLRVCSNPVTGISISGDKPGTTDYTVECAAGLSVSLSAPSSYIALNGSHYSFVKWIVGGGDKIGNPVSIVIDQDETAVALYQFVPWPLTVQSAPISAVRVSGDKPGLTSYTAPCDDLQVIGLQAPPAQMASGARYEFAHWTLNGTDKPEGQTSVAITMDQAVTAIAVYSRITPQVILKGPVERGEAPLLSGGGTFKADICLKNVYTLYNAEIGLKITDPAGNNAGFTISTANGNPRLAGLAVEFNGAAFPDAALYIASGPCFGLAAAPNPWDLADETRLFTITYNYGAAALGNYTISLNTARTVLYDVNMTTISVQTLPGSVTIIPKRTLSVQSSPVPGFAISGDKPGSTDYSATCADQQVVNLSALPLVTLSGSDYSFVRWVLDGINQPDLQTSIAVTMNADRTAVAQYFRHCTLSVRSSPITGVLVGGDKPGRTEYSAEFERQETVTLSAQSGVMASARSFPFVRWTLDGASQPLRQADFQVTMDTDHAAVAVYALFGDANGDCKVNVLDLLQTRNRLAQSASTADNWKADFDQSGKIDILDLILVRNQMGRNCP